MTDGVTGRRARTKAVAHYERTGLILPGHAAEIAAYLAERAEQS